MDTVTPALIETAWGGLWVFDAALACCALESRAALLGRAAATGNEPSALALLITGTISQKLAPSVQSVYGTFLDYRAELPHYVVAVGACASSGGPYWDSPAIVAGIGELGIACDLYVPGCPPRPREIVAALEGLMASRGPDE